ncbi:MAG: hypothetical protein ACKVON_08070 [Beijerinckiaceae bacterium]
MSHQTRAKTIALWALVPLGIVLAIAVFSTGLYATVYIIGSALKASGVVG